MIVICTKCKAKFRVADDRIGPRGAKVRCSRCQTVFHVQPEAAATTQLEAPPAEPSVPPRRGMDVELENPFASSLAEPAPASSPEPDPFAAAGFGVAVAPAPADDPFAAPSAAADPFAPRAAEPDPFAAVDPFVAPAAEPVLGDAERLAVTDISDLLGSVPAPDPLPAEAPPDLVPPPLPLPPAAPADDGGLSLEDRITPPPLPRPVLGADGLLAAHAGEALGAPDPQAFGAFELGEGLADAPLALATESPPAPPAEVVPAPAAALHVAESPPPPRPLRAAESAALAGRMPHPRPSRLRAVVVNAVALVALLAVALAMLVVWREGPLEAASLRPSAILAALGRGGGSGPFTALEVRSGVYERERAPPLLFVRGKVVSRASAPVRGVKVSVEVVRADAVIARGEALAGAIPTPEELYHANDAAAVAALGRAAGARAPAAVRPGDAVPFLVAIADHPSDLDGASLRVALAETGGTAR